MCGSHHNVLCTPHHAWFRNEQVLGIVTHHGSSHARIAADAERRRHVLQGVLVAPVIPEWLQTALLTVLLAYVASKTLAKGQKQFQKERSSVRTTPQPAVQCACACPICLMFIVCNASSHRSMDRHGCTRHIRRHEQLLSPCAPPCSVHLDACSWAACCLLATGKHVLVEVQGAHSLCKIECVSTQRCEGQYGTATGWQHRAPRIAGGGPHRRRHCNERCRGSRSGGGGQ